MKAQLFSFLIVPVLVACAGQAIDPAPMAPFPLESGRSDPANPVLPIGDEEDTSPETGDDGFPYRVESHPGYRNLAVYLVRGKGGDEDTTYLTLEEALRQGRVVVRETSRVSRLTVENLSAKAAVYILAGDIVKGGKQDRVLAVDLVLPPRSGRVNVPSFCVEQGRWSRRGDESVQQFNQSAYVLATREQKLAARLRWSQSEVWQEVRKLQQRLAARLARDVRDGASRSSLQLTLEHDRVVRAVLEYIDETVDLPAESGDVLGFAYAINGTFAGAEIFNSASLFRKLWPKLLRAAAVEALARFGDRSRWMDPTAEAIRERLKKADAGVEREMTRDKHRLLVRESRQTLVLRSAPSRPAKPERRHDPHPPAACPAPPPPNATPVPIPRTSYVPSGKSGGKSGGGGGDKKK
jgi:hypothetical protein